MAEATIPVDLRNPGQVFACLGLMEAAHVLLGPGEVNGGYAWADGASTARFTLAAPGDADPVRVVLDFLFQAHVEAVGYRDSVPFKSSWKLHTRTITNDVANIPPSKPDKDGELKPNPMLPAAIVVTDRELAISSWGETSALGRDNLKFWAGSAGMPGARFVVDAIDLVSDLRSADRQVAYSDPFSVARRQSSSFNFDRRRIAPALDAGFSVDAQKGKVFAVGYPLVELLAAVGLQNARPERIDKLNYRYAVASSPLPLLFARAVLGAQTLGFPARTFRMRLGWPGQEGQARCILDAQEEHPQ
jgi:CRISPR-associated protein Csx14